MQIDETIDVEFVYDYGQVFLYDQGYAFSPDADEYVDALEEARAAGRGFGLSGGVAVVLCPAQYNFQAPLAVELHDVEPSLDEGWDQVSELPLALPSGRMLLEAAGGAGSAQVELPPGDYQARWSGTGFAGAEPYGPSGEEAQEDRYRLQLWPGPGEPRELTTWPGFAAQVPQR